MVANSCHMLKLHHDHHSPLGGLYYEIYRKWIGTIIMKSFATSLRCYRSRDPNKNAKGRSWNVTQRYMVHVWVMQMVAVWSRSASWRSGIQLLHTNTIPAFSSQSDQYLFLWPPILRMPSSLFCWYLSRKQARKTLAPNAAVWHKCL